MKLKMKDCLSQNRLLYYAKRMGRALQTDGHRMINGCPSDGEQMGIGLKMNADEMEMLSVGMGKKKASVSQVMLNEVKQLF